MEGICDITKERTKEGIEGIVEEYTRRIRELPGGGRGRNRESDLGRMRKLEMVSGL